VAQGTRGREVNATCGRGKVTTKHRGATSRVVAQEQPHLTQYVLGADNASQPGVRSSRDGPSGSLLRRALDPTSRTVTRRLAAAYACRGPGIPQTLGPAAQRRTVRVPPGADDANHHKPILWLADTQAKTAPVTPTGIDRVTLSSASPEDTTCVPDMRTTPATGHHVPRVRLAALARLHRFGHGSPLSAMPRL
jgi:hypothetical protein